MSLTLDEAVIVGLKSIRTYDIDGYAARCFQDTLKACGYTISRTPENPCPCGISPESWVFCSAGTCDVCKTSRDYIEAVQAIKHTDTSVPCPTCGFHVITVEAKPFVITDDDC